MKTFCLLLSAAAICCFGNLRAQSTPPDEKPVLPPGPLIQKRAPDFSRWTLTAKVSTGKPSEKASASLAGNPDQAVANVTTITVTKTGPVIHVVRLDEQHRTWQTWCRGTAQVAITPSSNQPALVALPASRDAVNPLFFDFSKSDFQGFEWLSAQNFTGVKPVLEKNCLVFKDERKVVGTLAPAPSSNPSDAAAATAPVVPVLNAIVACVDLDTRLPVALMNDNGVITYQFQDAPTAMQEFPPNVQALLDKQKNDAQALKRKPNTPY